jgi:opacity protein-like surface antigen
MKLKTIGSFASLAALALIPSRAIEPGFFVTGSVGANLVQDINLPVAPPVNIVRLEFDPGLRADATVGYTFFANPSIAIAAAGEVGFMYNSLDQGTGNGRTLKIDGDFFQSPFLGKILFKFLPDSNISPYLSAGGGGLYSRMDIHSIGGMITDSTGDETDPAFQAEAGVNYKLGDRAAIGLAYKFVEAFPDSDLDHFINHSIVAMFSANF